MSKLKYRLLFILCLGAFVTASAQQKKINSDMAKYFVGSWTGAGEFANGKKIEADVSFYLSVDSTSLINIYTDKAPNRYKATSAWTLGADGNMVAHIINNFTALKDFTSDGWQNGKIVLTNKEPYQNKGLLYQQFTFEKIDDDNFKVTYVYGLDPAKLKEGDHLVFSRSKPE